MDVEHRMRAESDRLLSDGRMLGRQAHNEKRGKPGRTRTLSCGFVFQVKDKKSWELSPPEAVQKRAASATDGLQRRLLSAIIIIPLINTALDRSGGYAEWQQSTFQVELGTPSRSRAAFF